MNVSDVDDRSLSHESQSDVNGIVITKIDQILLSNAANNNDEQKVTTSGSVDDTEMAVDRRQPRECVSVAFGVFWNMQIFRIRQPSVPREI